MNERRPRRRRGDRLPLPSEDTGDLIDAPASGQTDNPYVATEEGVPYQPPMEPTDRRRPFDDIEPEVDDAE